MVWSEFGKILLLGLLEGVTEWLPVSSTGHMLLLDAALPLRADGAFREMFFVVVQLGAVCAVPACFPARFRLPGPGAARRAAVRLWLRVLAACVPAGAAGLLLDEFLTARFGTPLTVAAMLALYGVLFLLAEARRETRPPRYGSAAEVPLRAALGIGLWQALALIPGTSRSGATMLGGLFLGLSRTAAAEFSFLMAVPTMLGASVFKLAKFGLAFTPPELAALLLGLAAAFGVSVLAIRFLLRAVRRFGFRPFGWYRILLALAVFLFIALKL